MEKPVHPGLQRDEGPESGQPRDLSRVECPHGIPDLDVLPGIGKRFLQAEGEAVPFPIQLDNRYVHLLSHGNRRRDLLPPPPNRVILNGRCFPARPVLSPDRGMPIWECGQNPRMPAPIRISKPPLISRSTVPSTGMPLRHASSSCARPRAPPPIFVVNRNSLFSADRK